MRRWIGLFVAATLAACSGSSKKDSPSPPPPDAYEPNDTIAQAKAIAATSSTPTTLGSATDRDYFKFDVTDPAGGIFRAMTFDGTGTSCALGLSTTVALRDSADNEIVTSGSGMNKCSDLIAFLPQGSYALDVTGASTSGYPAAYTLVTSLAATPTTPYLNDEIAGSIASPTDFQCFAVVNATGADVTARLATYVGSGVSCTSATAGQDDTVLRVLDGAATVASDDNGGVSPCSLLYQPIPSGATRYACVTASPGKTVPSYRLLVSTGSEPNEAIAQATQIAATSATSAWLSSGSDLDYYKFDVTEAGGGIFRAMTFDGAGAGCDSTLFTTIDLYSSGGVLLQTTSSDAWNTSGCADLLAYLPQGTYAVNVYDSYGGSTYPAVYTLVTSLVTPPASPYSTTNLVDGSITATAGFDCYAIQNQTSASVPVGLETYVGGSGKCESATYQNDTYLRVLDPNGAIAASDDDGGSSGFCSMVSGYSLAANDLRYACVTAYPGTTVPQYQLQITFP